MVVTGVQNLNVIKSALAVHIVDASSVPNTKPTIEALFALNGVKLGNGLESRWQLLNVNVILLWHCFSPCRFHRVLSQRFYQVGSFSGNGYEFVSGKLTCLDSAQPVCPHPHFFEKMAGVFDPVPSADTSQHKLASIFRASN
jgi:hypothetical protein